MNDKLAKLQAAGRLGGKGTPRRSVKKVHKPAAAADDKKLQATLKKLGVQSIPGIEEVNLFRNDGKIIHFVNPKVQASIGANVFTISGNGQEKELTDLVPGILTQLGPESLATLRKLAESFKTGAPAQAGDDDVPDLVENFEEAD